MTHHPMEDRSRGRVEVITGGMFSGKSEELVRRLRRAVIAGQKVQVFKPVTDHRNPGERLVTRDNRELEAVTVATAGELGRRVEPETDVVGIDEAQFFEADLVELADRLADRGVRVIVAGLDLDYLRRPFGPMHLFLARAEFVDKMHAVCVRCGGTAHYSQRIAGGGDQILVGDGEAYEARCRSCYEEYAVEVAAARR
ncbi:MAG TPA: thymidine kinase [Thermoanaerobaculia bacterium]|nr:thymidine kinase [Thermoanaerobaculia bacterium]